MFFSRDMVVFKQYTPKKYKEFGVKSYKLCGAIEYTYNVCVFRQREEVCDCNGDSYSCNCDRT
jgi:hypothetical protein